jgi:4-hydroxybenzoate polyprenyltransferase
LIRRYGIALLFVAAAFVSTYLLQPFFPYPFLFIFFAAVMASAWPQNKAQRSGPTP